MIERIGVFDSGMGGLTVLRQLRAAFPRPDMVYLGDTARVPYGGRSPETINRYAREDVEFLLHRRVDAVVVACGTVSSNSLDYLRQRFDVPIFGVIDSAARRAAALTKTGSVGVIGTAATIRSGAFERSLRREREDLQVISRACPLIVPLVENAVAPDDPVAGIICGRYLSAFAGKDIDTLIMGCTHYPVYRAAFARLLPGVTLVDPGEALAQDLGPAFSGAAGEGRTEYFVTEHSAAFTELVRVMDPELDADSIQVTGLDT
ncbi:MAG: glutamate racemase [Oscillospiraceae bacterium]|nr:glutamate racemase [Oscillospiraceae bacterium]